jgi:hypothetical protein
MALPPTLMDAGRWKPLLLDLLRPRASSAAHAWVGGVCSHLTGSQGRTALLDAYTSAARQLGRSPLALTDAERSAVAEVDPEAALVTWTVADLGRAILLHCAQEASTTEAGSAELLLSVYEEGDSSEQQSWLRSLPLLPRPERFLAAAIDACRTNILPQFESIACENPFPARHFPERNFNQLVLKVLFNNLALMRIVGLERRFNAELSRMADDYVSEREAAARSVPPDIWLVIGPQAAGRSLDRMQRYLQHDDPAHRHWAGIGLGLAKSTALKNTTSNVQRS